MTDQFFLFEALASSHIRRFSFQVVHCRSYLVRRRPCLIGGGDGGGGDDGGIHRVGCGWWCWDGEVVMVGMVVVGRLWW